MKIVTNRLASTRTEVRKGKEYLVSPVVVIKEGILNDRFVPGEEIERFAESWNGRPVPVRHPKRGNQHVSANSLDILDEVVVGQLFNAHYEDAALKGEIWIDVQRAMGMGNEIAQIVANLKQGKPYEVSSAYWADDEAVTGEWGGIQYNAISRNLTPDHIAILPDEIGACSWQDGCGTPRVNSMQVNSCNCKGKNEMKDELIKAILSVNSKMTKEFLETLDETTLTVLNEALTPDENQEAAQETQPVIANAQVPAEFNDLMAQMRQIIANANAVVENEKKTLVARIVANSSFTEAELSGMATDVLRKLETTLVPGDYSGRGGALSTNAADSEWEPYVKPEVK